MTKEIWHSIIGFQSSLPESSDVISLDLKFLIQLEQDGYQGSLNFYKASKQIIKRRSEVQEQQRITEIKLLIQYVYAFTPAKPRDSSSILYQKPTSMTYKNVYFRCLMSLIDTTQIRQMLDTASFEDVQLELAKALIGTKTEKLIKAGLVPKLFLVCLFITVNVVDKSFVEQSLTPHIEQKSVQLWNTCYVGQDFEPNSGEQWEYIQCFTTIEQLQHIFFSANALELFDWYMLKEPLNTEYRN